MYIKCSKENCANECLRRYDYCKYCIIDSLYNDVALLKERVLILEKVNETTKEVVEKEEETL